MRWYAFIMVITRTYTVQSPLWQPPILRSNLFKRFASCLLHNEVLGNLLRHLKLLGEMMGEADILSKYCNLVI